MREKCKITGDLYYWKAIVTRIGMTSSLWPGCRVSEEEFLFDFLSLQEENVAFRETGWTDHGPAGGTLRETFDLGGGNRQSRAEVCHLIGPVDGF